MTATAVKGRLWELSARAEANQNLPGAAFLKAGADEILIGIEIAERKYREEIEEVHGDMDRARAGNPEARATYNKREKAILRWLQIAPRNELPTVSPIPPMEPAPQPDPVIDWEAVGRGVAAGMAPASAAINEKIDRIAPEVAKGKK